MSEDTALDSEVGIFSPRPTNRVTVRVPATTANMGPGYDVLGMAVNIWNELVVERSKEFSFEIEGEGADLLPRDEKNLVVKGLQEAYREMNKKIPTLSYKCLNRIPFARGLGSSSAGIISGLLAGYALENHQETENEEELLQIAGRIEGHPDNVAPCIYGGLVLGYISNELFKTQRISIPFGLLLVIFVPDHSTETQAARDLLKGEISRNDAIYNMSRLALLVSALQTGDMDLLAEATQDKLHQPQRGAAIHPHMQPLIEASLEHGAHACFLSGSGPSIMAICSGKKGDILSQSNDMRREKKVAIGMMKKAEEIGCPGKIIISQPTELGGHVVPELSNTNPMSRVSDVDGAKYADLIRYA